MLYFVIGLIVGMVLTLITIAAITYYYRNFKE